MKTNIYGTIGPACCDTNMLVRLFKAGMTGVRINLSHSNLKNAAGWLGNIRTACRIALGADARPEILMDLRGPELRIGKLENGRMLCEGEYVSLVPEGCNHLLDPTEIPAPAIMVSGLKQGQEILLDDGKILLLAEEVYQLEKQSAVKCRVMRAGLLKSGKSIAAPKASFYPPTLTESDRKNITDAKEYGITGVMLPFVRDRKDLQNLKEALKEAGIDDMRIFAKIENRDGIRQLSELLMDCDEVVIARGDLGNDVPLWELPVIQAQIARQCTEAGKPFMVVTQMLASMEESAVPTRAEVSDIFLALQEGAASLMLTGETAAGKYPADAMMYMANTVKEAEKFKLDLI